MSKYKHFTCHTNRFSDTLNTRARIPFTKALCVFFVAVLLYTPTASIDLTQLNDVVMKLFFNGSNPTLSNDPDTVTAVAKNITSNPDVATWLKSKAFELALRGKSSDEIPTSVMDEFLAFLKEKLNNKTAAERAAQATAQRANMGSYNFPGGQPMYSNVHPGMAYGINVGMGYNQPPYGQPIPNQPFTYSQSGYTKEGYQNERQGTYRYDTITPGYGAPYRGQAGYQNERYYPQPQYPQPQPGYPSQNQRTDNAAPGINPQNYNRYNPYSSVQGMNKPYESQGQTGSGQYSNIPFTGQSNVRPNENHFKPGPYSSGNNQAQTNFKPDDSATRDQNPLKPDQYNTVQNQNYFTQSPYNTWQYQNVNNLGSGQTVFTQRPFQPYYATYSYGNYHKYVPTDSPPTTGKPNGFKGYGDVWDYVKKTIVKAL